MSIIDKIANSIKNNYMIPKYNIFINFNDKSIIDDFNKFGNDILEKLGDEFHIYKYEFNSIIYKKDDIYILIEYVLFESTYNVEFEINIFNSSTHLESYLLS
jgi:hypothetical protein